MKIGFKGLDFPEGKIKYNDEVLNSLAAKDKPKKVSPFFVEFLKENYLDSDAIIIHKDYLLDILIFDMEKIENRINRTTDNHEVSLLKKCIQSLEEEKPLFDMDFDKAESEILTTLSLCSYKPIIQINDNYETNDMIKLVLEKTSNMFFYTSGASESHAWLVPQNSSIIFCASKIHTDLARGFIKGDVVSYNDYMNHHNFNECKSKGVAKMVDKDYIVQPNEIIEIRFNV